MSHLSPAEARAVALDHHAFADRYARKLAHRMRMAEHADDAAGEAMIGLVEAAQKFDPGLGVPFGAYAKFYILNRVGRFLSASRGAVRVTGSARVGEDAVRMGRVASGLRMRLGREPTAEDFAAELGIPVERVRRVRGGSRITVPLSTSGDFEEGRHSAPSPDPSPEELAAAAESQALAREAVSRALGALTRREADIIRSRRVTEEPELMRSIAARYGVTKQAVDLADKRALPKFERALRRHAAELGWEAA